MKTFTVEAEVDTTQVSSKAHENEISLDDILSADSEGSKVHLDGSSDEVGQQRVSGYVLKLS